MGVTVEIATQHSDYPTKNLIAIRAEKRAALVVSRPASYITGTFTTSPALILIQRNGAFKLWRLHGYRDTSLVRLRR